MVRTTKDRKNKGRKPRRRPASSNRLSNLPPFIPFHQCFMNIVLRHIIALDNMPINSRKDDSLAIKDLFDGPWIDLRTVFSQVRVCKVHMYATAGVGYDERGYHALNLAPIDEFKISDGVKWSVLCSLPGTRMTRITRMVSTVWIPTGPIEKDWYKTDSSTALMEYTYMAHSQTDPGKANKLYPLELTIDAHVKLRGVAYQRLQMRQSSDDLDAEFVNLAT